MRVFNSFKQEAEKGRSMNGVSNLQNAVLIACAV